MQASQILLAQPTVDGTFVEQRPDQIQRIGHVFSPGWFLQVDSRYRTLARIDL